MWCTLQDHAHSTSLLSHVSISQAPAALALSRAAIDAVAQMPSLRNLSLASCGVRTLAQLQPLVAVTALTSLDVRHNPIAGLALLHAFVAAQLPAVCMLNGTPVSKSLSTIGHNGLTHGSGGVAHAMQAFLSHVNHAKLQREEMLLVSSLQPEMQAANVKDAVPGVEAGEPLREVACQRRNQTAQSVMQDCLNVHAKWQELAECWPGLVTDLCAEVGRSHIDAL